MKTQLKELLTRFQSSGNKSERAIMQKGNVGITGKRKKMNTNPVSPVMGRRAIH
jgi:hypothetical protein